MLSLMVTHSSHHRNSRISSKCGEYSTGSHHPPMHSLMDKWNVLYRLSRIVSPKLWGEDLHLTILSYITTPLNHSLPSPAELLNSRKFRCLLPLQLEQQNHI